MPLLRASTLKSARSRGLHRSNLVATFLRSPREVTFFLVRFLPKSLSFLKFNAICRIEIILRYFDIKVKSFFKFRLVNPIVAKLILALDIEGIFVYS